MTKPSTTHIQAKCRYCGTPVSYFGKVCGDCRADGEPASLADQAMAEEVAARVAAERAATRRLGTCQWFAMCDNVAIGTVTHPVLGNVPTCRRCADKLGLVLVTA